jgi:hypothetical protein
MLDPVSIINCIQFAFQCGQLVIQAAQETQKAIKKGREAEIWMADYRSNFRICLNNLESWAETWGFRRSEPFDEADLRQYWGNGLYDDVQKHLHCASSLANSIERRISGSSKKHGLREILSKQDWLEWKGQERVTRTLSELQPLAEELCLKYSAKLAKFSWALFDDDRIHTDIQSLKSTTELLTVVCRSTYNRFRNVDINSHVMTDDIAKIEGLRRQVQRFTSFARDLHERSSDLKYQWSLELREPDAFANAAEWRFLRIVNLDFTLHDHDTSVPSASRSYVGCKRFRICYDPDIDHGSQLYYLIKDIEGSYLDDKVIDSGSIQRNMAKPLGECLKLSKPLSVLFRAEEMQNKRTITAWELDCARLLYAFVNWMILLFDTPWTQHACCCDIRFQKLNDHSLKFVVCTELERSCQNVLFRGQKLVMLGIVLSEIILRRPLSEVTQYQSRDILSLGESSSTMPYFSDSKISFSLSGSEIPVWKESDIQKIAAEVRQAGYPIDVAEAIEYCFMHGALVDQDTRWYQIINDLVVKVLLPFKEYLEILEGNKSRLNLASWWNFFSSYWPNESCYDSGSGLCQGFQTRQISTQDMDNIPGAFPSSFM